MHRLGIACKDATIDQWRRTFTSNGAWNYQLKFSANASNATQCIDGLHGYSVFPSGVVKLAFAPLLYLCCLAFAKSLGACDP